jgi:3-phosphoinositide dependent protein kinase-1
LADIFVGTAEYVSPEVLNEDGEISKACDLWAIGCILFQMCVGRPPFHAETEYLIFQNINSHADGSCPLVYPSTVSESEKSLMEGLLVCNSCMRLGAGTCEEQRDMHGLKQHSFFDGVDWENLHVMTAPFQPDPATFPSRDNMRDGNMEEWLLDDDDVSPLLPIITHNDINVTRSSSGMIYLKRSCLLYFSFFLCHVKLIAV